MKAVVAGASGFLGRHLCRRFQDLGWNVTGLIRRSSDRAGLLPGVTVHAVESWSAPLFLSAVDGADLVVDVAGRQGGDEVSAEAIREANLDTAVELGTAAAGRVGKLVYVSSVRVYGVGHRLPISESTPLRPTTEYGRAKAEAERRLHGLAGLRSVALRLSEVYGPGDTRSMIFKIVDLVRRRIRVWPGSGKNLVHPCFLDDALDAIVLAGTEARASGVLVIAGAEALEVGRIVETAARLLAVRPPRLHIPTLLLQSLAAAGKPARALGLPYPITESQVQTLCDHRSYDLSLSRSVLGYLPSTGIAVGLERAIGDRSLAA